MTSGSPSKPLAEGYFNSLRTRRTRNALLVAVLALALAASVLAATAIGAVAVSVEDVASSVLNWLGISNGETDAVTRTIVLQIRLPRVALATLAGAALAVAGAAFQAVFKNSLADPYVIGASSGASLGAAIAIVVALPLHVMGLGTVPLLAFAGSVGAVLLVYHLARVGGQVETPTLLLAGVAVSSLLSALVSLLIYFSGEKLHQVIFWLMGGFSGASWVFVKAALPYIAGSLAVITIYRRELNALLLGEDTAHSLGVDVAATRRILLAAASLLTATAVSTAGIIGFVGLVVPHVVRLLAGPDHRTLVPASALAGATMMVGADLVARTIIAPTELPVGVVTALIGGPFFIYLLRHRRTGRG